ncbi:MAG: dihydrolipoyl dehydrogenase [Syntrophomonadaceae bacterium]|jgi:dihydrolipoamide dehydrogenase
MKEEGMKTMYDVIIIGGGPGGYVAAIRARQLGLQVLLIEKAQLGGTCLNRGCIPTKAYYKDAHFIKELARSSQFGVEVPSWRFNLAQAWESKQKIVQTLVSGVERLLQANGVQVLQGQACLLDGHTVLVNGEQYQSRFILLATGSVPAPLALSGMDLPGVINSDDILDIKELPQRLAIIGGGVIGLEFACIFQAFGSQVTVIEYLPGLLNGLDEELGKRLGVFLKRQGINVMTATAVQSIQGLNSGLQIKAENKKGLLEIDSDVILVAAGRLPCTAGLNLDGSGVKTGPRGFVEVDATYKTAVDSIYAIGDVIGGQMLAHVASEEGVAAVEDMAGLRSRSASPVVPSCIFTIPEIATVGLSEQQARERGVKYRRGKFQFAANGKALTMAATDGLVKVLVDEADVVIGVHILGPHASDIILEGLVLVQGQITRSQAIDMIHPHPTLGEALREAVLDAGGEAIHLAPARR